MSGMSVYDESKHRRGGNPTNTGEYSQKANSGPESDLPAPTDAAVTWGFAYSDVKLTAQEALDEFAETLDLPAGITEKLWVGTDYSRPAEWNLAVIRQNAQANNFDLGYKLPTNSAVPRDRAAAARERFDHRDDIIDRFKINSGRTKIHADRVFELPASGNTPEQKLRATLVIDDGAWSASKVEMWTHDGWVEVSSRRAVEVYGGVKLPSNRAHSEEELEASAREFQDQQILDAIRVIS